MRVILDVLEGPQKGRSFVFERHDTFIVGRSRFVHCPMPEDMALSRDHFMIEINPPQCEMRDLGSTNGTFVNNQSSRPGSAGFGRHDRGGAERLPGRGGIGRRISPRGMTFAKARATGDTMSPRVRSDAPAVGRWRPRI